MHLRIPENQGTLGFACDHDGHHKARLVAGGHLTVVFMVHVAWG